MCPIVGILGPHLMIQDCDGSESFVVMCLLLCGTQLEGFKRLLEPFLDLESDSSIS